MSTIGPDWPVPERVRALVTTRSFGDMARGGPGRDEVRKLVPGEPLWLRQVHGAAVADADAVREADAGPQADAAVARGKGTVCAVTIADCMPVFFADAAGTAVGVAHAGWRGLCGGVLEATVGAMGVAPGALVAWLGPAIGARTYEVGDEVRAAFLSRERSAAQAFSATRPGHWLLDLYAAARQRLARTGVRNVLGGGFCTYSDPQRFFSYRRDRTAARMAALIWLA